MSARKQMPHVDLAAYLVVEEANTRPYPTLPRKMVRVVHKGMRYVYHAPPPPMVRPFKRALEEKFAVGGVPAVLEGDYPDYVIN